MLVDNKTPRIFLPVIISVNRVNVPYFYHFIGNTIVSASRKISAITQFTHAVIFRYGVGGARYQLAIRSEYCKLKTKERLIRL